MKESVPVFDNEDDRDEEEDYDPEPVYLDDRKKSPSPADEIADDDAPSILEAVAATDSGRQWYVVHCYSGYENKVRHAIEQRIETMGMRDKIFDVIVPTQDEIEIKEGKRRSVERRVFPGYI